MKKIRILVTLGIMVTSITACGGTKVTEDKLSQEAVSMETSEELSSESGEIEEASAESQEPEKQEEQGIVNFHFTKGNLPRIDGSTSTLPLAVATCAELLGEDPKIIEEELKFHKTTQAYMNLLNGDADLLIVGEANQEVMGEKEELQFEWEKEPFATDAFIFVVNEANPVDSITIEQARKIYTGEITNWKELGGEDLAIVALQRNEGAGSQTLMEKHIMKGEPMMEAPTECLIGSMGQLMEAVKSYDETTAGAIGYSVYYYAEEMKMAQGLKMLKLEGVEPTPETIRNETYPIINPKYVVIPASAGENSANRKMFEWLLSKEGQTLIAKEGYVSIMDVGYFPKTTPTVGSRLHEGYMGELKPSTEYGELIPYAGRRLADGWPATTGCRYGLMTKNGVAVTDAVYTYVGYLSCNGQEEHPLLILEQGIPDGDWYTQKVTIAAYDGSFVVSGDYITAVDAMEGVILYSEDKITLLNPDGTVREVLTQTQLGLTDEQFRFMVADVMEFGEAAGSWYHDLIGLVYVDGGIMYYDVSEHQTKVLTYDEWEVFYYPKQAPEIDFEEEGAYYETDSATYMKQNEKYLICRCDREKWITHYYKADGTPIPGAITDSDRWYKQVHLKNGVIEVLDLNTATYFDYDTMECIFKSYLGFEAE